MARDATAPRVHLVMVPNPPYHPARRFRRSTASASRSTAEPRLTFGNIGVYDTALFADFRAASKLKLLPLYQRVDRASVSCRGERYDGPWANVGTPADLAALDAALTRALGDLTNARDDR